MNIDRSLRLPDAEYLHKVFPKDLIVLHHTVGGSAKSTFRWWTTDPLRVGTAYIIERDGTVFEVFPPEKWCFHLGVKDSWIDKRSIGIELASEGALMERGGKLYAFGVFSERTEYQREKAVVFGEAWHGYRWFDGYDEPQIEACFELVGELIERFNIPRQMPRHTWCFDAHYHQFQGVLGHLHVRRDKSDVHPLFPWKEMGARLGLAEV